MSLSRVLGRCRGWYVTHEAWPHLTWNPWEESHPVSYAAKLRLLGADRTGDIHPAYLPILPQLLADVPGLRVVCMERPRPQVVASFMAWTRGVNYWQDHDGAAFNHGPWDQAFPHFDAPSKQVAIGLYWDLYYREIRQVEAAHPGRVLLLPAAALSLKAGQQKLFDHLGILAADRYYSLGTHLNQRPNE